MSLSPHLPTWNDSPTEAPVTTGDEIKPWSDTEKEIKPWIPYEAPKTTEEKVKVVELEKVATPEEPLEEVLEEEYAEDATPLDPPDETDVKPTDIFTLIEEANMPYRVAKVFEMLYNVKTANNLIPSIYDEILANLTNCIVRYTDEELKKFPKPQFSQNIDVTLSLYGVDYAIGTMMHMLLHTFIWRMNCDLCDAKALLLTVGCVDQK